MWNLPDATALAEVAHGTFERTGVVSAVCHGHAALATMAALLGAPRWS
jgi:putative intracellular protease/amidase